MIPDLAWWGRLIGLLAAEAALLVAVATAASWRVRSAQWQRLVWQSAFLAVLLVWSAELAGGRAWIARFRPELELSRRVTARVIGEIPVRGEEVAFEFPGDVPSAPATLPPELPQARWWPGAFWLTGLVVMLLRTIGSRAWVAWRFRRSRRQEALAEVGQRRSEVGSPQGGVTSAPTQEVVGRLRARLGLGAVRVVVWPRLCGPVAFGIFRPTVAVPADFAERFPPAQREAMLAHELGHLAQRDPLWLLVAELVCAFAWWHPAVWWARRQFRAACEAAADEATALVPGGRVALAEALVSVGRELTAPGGVGVGGSGLKSELARRVQALVEHPGDGGAVRGAGRWLLRTGIAAVLVALLFAPWPGDRNGLGTVLAAVQAETAQSASQAGKRLQTISDVLADPQFREVVKALEAAAGDSPPRAQSPADLFAADKRPSLESVVHEGIPVAGIGYDKRPMLGETNALHPLPPETFTNPRDSRKRASAVESLKAAKQALDEAAALHGRTSLEWTNAFNRLLAADRTLAGLMQANPGNLADDPNRSRLLAALETLVVPGFEANRERLDAVVRRLESAAKSADPEGKGLNFIINEPDDAGALSATVINVPTLRGARLMDVVFNVVTGAEPPIAAAVESYAVVFSVRPPVTVQLHTRQFRLSAPDFARHLQPFLPVGETNSAKAFQLAVRAFCAANGIEFPSAITIAQGSTPPPDQSAIFYNDRTGQLFVRATLENLERIEQALQKLDLPPAQEAKPRAELEAQLRASGNTLAELRSRYRERHPRVVDAQTQHDDLLARLRVLSQTKALTNAAVVISSPAPTPPLLTRQFRVDSGNFSARVLAAFDPVAEVARKLDALPNRELIASDVGASVSRTALPASVPSTPLPGVSGKGDTKDQQLGGAIHAYFRKHGVEFPTPTSQVTSGSEAQERPALFFKPDSGILFVRASLEDMATVERALEGLEPTDQMPQVELAVTLVEIADGGPDDMGLDWLFGQAATNNPPVVSALATNLPGVAGALQGDRLRVDRLAVAGQSAVLSAEQFAALEGRLKERHSVDFLSAPKVITLSGRQAQVSVGEIRTLVTGAVATDGSKTNEAGIQYLTDQVPVGPVVDLFPTASEGAWQVKVVASVTEFLGYDDPGKTNRVQAATAEGKPLKGTPPLPRLRVRETQSTASAKAGEVIALRGPLAENVVRFKDKVPVLGDVPLLGRLFRSESQQTRRTRLYVFVRPETVDAQGNRPAAK